MPKAPKAVIAFHDAGHAVAAIVHNIDIGSLSIAKGGRRGDGDPTERRLDASLRNLSDETRQVSIERAIMVAMAGDIAQRRFAAKSTHDEHSTVDRRRINECIEELDTPTDAIRDAYLRVLRMRAEVLIDRNWECVESIAALLAARGQISPAEARHAFANHDSGLAAGPGNEAPDTDRGTTKPNGSKPANAGVQVAVAAVYPAGAMLRVKDICSTKDKPGLLPIVERTWLKWVKAGRVPEGRLLSPKTRVWSLEVVQVVMLHGPAKLPPKKSQTSHRISQAGDLWPG